MYKLQTSIQGLLWFPKSRSQKNRQVPVLKVRSQFRSQLKFLQGVNFFEPKVCMNACTTTSFMYKWSGFVCTNVNVCIVLLFFFSISSSKTKRFICILRIIRDSARILRPLVTFVEHIFNELNLIISYFALLVSNGD